jgi:hypothetical protein
MYHGFRARRQLREGGCTMGERIGDFFVQNGLMDTIQVQTVIQKQKAGDKRVFGVIALKLGYITEDAIKIYVDHLEKQLNSFEGYGTPN